jgi:hypothetical protein
MVNVFSEHLYSQTYTYPDGTMGTGKPVDGQVFVTWDRNQKVTGSWVWQDSKGQWSRFYGSPNAGEQDLLREFERMVSEGEANCECGSEKAGSSRHSGWCPKYTK